METIVLSRDEVARKAKAIYAERLREVLETEGNIGKMVIIDIETGDYAVDTMGIDSAHELLRRHPNARLYGIRIGYNVAEALGGMIERTMP